MAVKGEYDLQKYLRRYMRDLAEGRKKQKSGIRIKKQSLRSYLHLSNLLQEFAQKTGQALRIRSLDRLNKRERNREHKYWKLFYEQFTNFLYRDKNCFDNYVASNIKLLRAFFNYLNNDLNLNVGQFHKHFYARQESLPVLVLTPERFDFLVSNEEFDRSLPKWLKPFKDVFVFGCTVGLRYSDLVTLDRSNFELQGDIWYLVVRSKKTNTPTRLKLPPHAVDIVKKQHSKRKKIFPFSSLSNLNKRLRQISELAGWTEEVRKARSKGGIPVEVFRNREKGTRYRFCDLVSSHLMRKTAVTTLIRMGLAPDMVRKISGHAPNSPEFYRYVEYAQAFLDNETDKAFERFITPKKQAILS
jgi:integrase